MLPFEVLTLVFLFSAATASPQIPQPTGANSTLSSDPSTLPTFKSSGEPFLVHEETTATGWETIVQPPTVHTETYESTWEASSSEPPTTSVPPPTSVAAIRTEIRVSITKLEPETEPTPPGDADYESSQGGGGGGAGQTSSTGDLLGNIISKITETRGRPTDQQASLTRDALSPSSPSENAVSPNAQPTAPSGGYTGQAQVTDNSLAMPVVQPTPGVGLSITVGPAILTLTPGLSTTIGSGLGETLVEMTTDSEGQTVVIVSSSGVATTATLYEATVTAPRSASITPKATSGGIREISSSTPTSTRHTGGGMHENGNIHIIWLAVLAGFGIVL